MPVSDHLDPYAKPPEEMRIVYKKYQKMKLHDLDSDQSIIDLQKGLLDHQLSQVKSVRTLDKNSVSMVWQGFLHLSTTTIEPTTNLNVYGLAHLPGLEILPSLIPPDVQVELLSRLVHRDLPNPNHKTNLHLHYDMIYPSKGTSYFKLPQETTFQPKDPSIHKPLSLSTVLTKKLRWVTLGGQYDWTAKRYPDAPPPAFPPDIASLTSGLFNTKAEAAILNFYSPGDTLSLHRDVSEDCENGLVSISLGCDGIFIIGLDDASSVASSEQQQQQMRYAVLRLRSGDAVYMNGASRFAWHGVPQIVAGTCPDYLKDWPASSYGSDGDEYGPTFEEWRGWMAGKRLNLNIRQMKDP
ncbi:hypothetical protein K402DRAFT_387620 [Aulographum hederae CBS 113979]|uniref:mRNA N(6)-methyladenine demethylase n=1 Tax=Aulographum hederae CBS 113979 TaxID=1176131 RepID=A0A6G1GIH5_9PEZI|nr:hypothetical protein K402DRAFT_387620 [Aulographum hederae CBS 113979]